MDLLLARADHPGGMNSESNHFSQWDSTALVVLVCSALALYNAVMLELIIFTTFHAYRGLYFWSLVLASFGIIPYVLGFFIEYFKWTHLWIGTAIDCTGWALMVTGQSVVLYSRLWLVFGGRHKRLLDGVKWMIICNGLLFHGSVAIVVFGSRAGNNENIKIAFSHAYNVLERIQMCGFCAQELFLSGLYIWKALDIIRAAERRRSQRLMWQLFGINVIIVALDITLLTFEFRSLHVIQQTIKGLFYSVKLKMELAILNKLIELSCTNAARVSHFTFANTDDFLDPTKTVWDITRFTPDFSSNQFTYPKWKSDLELSGLERVESAYSPTEKTWTKTLQVTTTTSQYFPDGTPRNPNALNTRIDGRIKGSARESDLMYADIVRGMASSN